jgi:hypothetical protein
VNAGISNSESRSAWASKNSQFLDSANIDLNGVQYVVRVQCFLIILEVKVDSCSPVHGCGDRGEG